MPAREVFVLASLSLVDFINQTTIDGVDQVASWTSDAQVGGGHKLCEARGVGLAGGHAVGTSSSCLVEALALAAPLQALIVSRLACGGAGPVVRITACQKAVMERGPARHLLADAALVVATRAGRFTFGGTSHHTQTVSWEADVWHALVHCAR